jgi:hypothetical protein
MRCLAFTLIGTAAAAVVLQEVMHEQLLTVTAGQVWRNTSQVIIERSSLAAGKRVKHHALCS